MCADLTYGSEWKHNQKTFSLPIGYSETELDIFLSLLDFEYGASRSEQELCGFIWYTNGEWSDRGECDGSEWWDHKSAPKIPDHLTELCKINSRNIMHEQPNETELAWVGKLNDLMREKTKSLLLYTMKDAFESPLVVCKNGTDVDGVDGWSETVSYANVLSANSKNDIHSTHHYMWVKD